MYKKIFLGTFNYFLSLQRASSKKCILICGTRFCLPLTNLFKIATRFNSWDLKLNNKPLKIKFFYICMAFIRDFIKSSKKRLFWGWIYVCTKKMGWLFNFLEVYLLDICLKYHKILVYWDWFSRFWKKRLPDLKNVISRKTRLKFFYYNFIQ